MMSIYKIPGAREVPTLSDMLADLGRPHPTVVADMLHVDVKTVRRWLSANAAPWPVLLSLYWITKWGLAHLDADLFNAAQAFRQLADAQGRELVSVRASLAAAEAALAVTRRGPVLAGHGVPFGVVVDMASRRDSIRRSAPSMAFTRPSSVSALADHPSAVPSTVAPMARNASCITAEPSARA